MYRDLLVGSTGFVGGNLRAKHTFAAVCHSSDIAAQYGTQPDLCVYAGVPAAMFLANADPEADMEVMRTARENLRKIAPKSLVLISSIAVFADSRGRCEDDAPGLPMAAIACSWNSGCGRILMMPSSCACPPCTARALRKTSCSTCTPSPRLC